MTTPTPTAHHDACVVGAGIAGMNALFVASRYLGKHQKVALIDRNPRPGGMWNNTYDYVRLHQPHPFFTAGNVKWTFDRDRSHLSSKDEVLDHMQHCVEEARKRVHVDELFGHEVIDIEEIGDVVHVSSRRADGSTSTITADKVIDARALDIQTNDPLPLSSTQVRSVSPDFCDMRTGEIAQDSAPVWVIGSGKTAMDTVHALVTAQPSREVNLVAGSGTFFFNRDLFYPRGARRWWSGKRSNKNLADLVDRFDGTNETAVMDWTRETYGLTAVEGAPHCFLGIISEAEMDTIRGGLARIVKGHLSEAIDGPDGPRLVLRDGETIALEPGTWVVNCTGYLTYREGVVDHAYVSNSGRVVTIGTSAMFGFTSFTAYFLTHLLFLGKIRDVPLYQVAGNEALRVAPVPAALLTMLAMTQLNISLVFEHAPAKVFRDFGLDFDRWYPLPRQLYGQIQFAMRHKRRREHYRRSLETAAQRFDLPLGPVVGESEARITEADLTEPGLR